VFDLDGIQLIQLARTLERGHYLSGRAIYPHGGEQGPTGPGPQFCVGAVENPSAPPLDYRIRRAAKKALAGARFLQLQMTYRTELLERFMRTAVDTGLSQRLAMIPSIMILRSAGAMRFVASNVPGIDMPAELVARVESAVDAEAECFEIAYELAGHAMSQPGVAGLHFISFRKDAGIAKLCARLGIGTKQERETHGHSPSVALG
jgi:methylenetetrahydrofolate reductase (NADPH)